MWYVATTLDKVSRDEKYMGIMNENDKGIYKIPKNTYRSLDLGEYDCQIDYLDNHSISQIIMRLR